MQYLIYGMRSETGKAEFTVEPIHSPIGKRLELDHIALPESQSCCFQILNPDGSNLLHQPIHYHRHDMKLYMIGKGGRLYLETGCKIILESTSPILDAGLFCILHDIVWGVRKY